MTHQWSYSSLKKFITCPKQYHEVRVLQNFQDQPHASANYGKEVHKAFEDYIKHGKELASNYKNNENLLKVLQAIPGVKHCEYELALDKDKKPCGFTDPLYWVRGIIDLLIICDSSPTAFILDYKTGNNRYADSKQLKLLALMVFAWFPKVEKIRAGLIFTSYKDFIPEEYSRTNISQLWGAFAGDLARLNHSFTHNYWPENPSGLCRRYCPVTSCTHHGT